MKVMERSHYQHSHTALKWKNAPHETCGQRTVAPSTYFPVSCVPFCLVNSDSLQIFNLVHYFAGSHLLHSSPLKLRTKPRQDLALASAYH